VKDTACTEEHAIPPPKVALPSQTNETATIEEKSHARKDQPRVSKRKRGHQQYLERWEKAQQTPKQE
jgi:hypothetical protein